VNILILHQYFLEEDGSGGSRFNEMTKIWCRNGHNITVIAGMMPDHTGSKRAEYKGKVLYKRKQGDITVYRCHVSRSYNKNFFGRFLGYLTFMATSFFVMFFKLKESYDVILMTSPPIHLGINAMLFSRLKKCKFIFEVRDLWPESIIETGVVRNKMLIWLLFRLESMLYRNAHMINVLTPAFQKTLIEKKNVPAQKVIYIPNAADFELSDTLLNTFDPSFKRKEEKAEGKFVIIYVGAHGLANGLGQILDTAELLSDTNVVFWLIGKGMQRGALIAESEKRHIANVRFFEPVPKNDVLKYIIASDMGVSILIKREVFKTIYSNKTFDYMACRKPVFMVIDGISRELIENADAGIFVEPENPSDFANKIRLYLNSHDKIKRQGENGYKYLKMNFDRQKLALEYLSQISKLAGE
jgi:glycosyltransferase involved in cell wall biosynthesis